MSGAIGYRQSFTCNSTDTLVTLDHAYADSNYVVCPELHYQTSWWITQKTSTTFHLHLGTTPGYVTNVDCWIYHE